MNILILNKLATVCVYVVMIENTDSWKDCFYFMQQGPSWDTNISPLRQ
jgi:hypothetical protein